MIVATGIDHSSNEEAFIKKLVDCNYSIGKEPMQFGNVKGYAFEEEDIGQFMTDGASFTNEENGEYEGVTLVTLEVSDEYDLDRIVPKVEDSEPVQLRARDDEENAAAAEIQMNMNPSKFKFKLPKGFPVLIDGWNGGRHFKEFVSAVETELLPYVSGTFKKVIIDGKHHGSPCDPESIGGGHSSTSDTLHIILYSTPNQTPAMCFPPATIRGRRICADVAYLPSDESTPIIWDDVICNTGTGEIQFAPAEIVDGSKIYVLFDIFHFGTKDEVELFKYVLNGAKEALDDSPEKVQKRKEELMRRSKKAYVDMAIKALNSQFTEMKRELVQHQKQIENARNTITTSYRRIETISELISSGDNEKVKKIRLEKEFDSVMSNEKVTSVRIRGGKLIFSTATIYCTDPRTSYLHKIGRFEITVNMGGISDDADESNSNRIQIKNLDGTTRGMGNNPMQAPHVFQAGNVCFGNGDMIVAKMIAKYEIGALIYYIIAFLESVNTSDQAGKWIFRWQRVDPETLEDIDPKHPVYKCKYSCSDCKHKSKCDYSPAALSKLSRKAKVEAEEMVEADPEEDEIEEEDEE